MTALRRATLLALALTYALIVLGAWVRATGSGLACPDWPTCYGHLLPLPGEIPQGAGYAYHQVMAEWLHRLLAGRDPRAAAPRDRLARLAGARGRSRACRPMPRR